MGKKNSLGMLISGEYEITEQKLDCGELSTTISLHIVTWERATDNCGRPYDKQFEKFEQELKELLSRYAI